MPRSRYGVASFPFRVFVGLNVKSASGGPEMTNHNSTLSLCNFLRFQLKFPSSLATSAFGAYLWVRLAVYKRNPNLEQ